MIEFVWNNVRLKVTDMGGGILRDVIPRHAHAKNSYELHFVIGGEGVCTTDTGRFRVRKGDFFVTGPNVYHGQTSEAASPVEDVFITLQAVEIQKRNVVSSVFLSNHFSIINDFDSFIAREALREYREKRPDYESAVSGLLIKLLTDITRCLLPPSFSESIPSANLNDRRFVIIEQAFLYSDNLTLGELSRRIGLCERQTQRLLKQYYGKSFREKKKERG